MLEEILVLSGNDGIYKFLWKIIDRNHVPLLVAEELGDDLSMDIQKCGWKSRPELFKLLGVCHIAIFGMENAEAESYKDTAYS